MKITKRNITTLLLTGAFVFTLSACSEGPAEETGKEIDELVKDAGNAVEDACEDVKEAAKTEDKDC